MPRHRAPLHTLGVKSQVIKTSGKNKEHSQSPRKEMEFVQPSEPLKAGKNSTGGKHHQDRAEKVLVSGPPSSDLGVFFLSGSELKPQCLGHGVHLL